MLCSSSPCCCIPRIADKTFAFCPESASIGRVKLNWLPLLDDILLSLSSFHPSPRNSRTLSYSKRIRRDSLRNLKELTAHAQIHFAATSQRLRSDFAAKCASCKSALSNVIYPYLQVCQIGKKRFQMQLQHTIKTQQVQYTTELKYGFFGNYECQKSQKKIFHLPTGS